MTTEAKELEKSAEDYMAIANKPFGTHQSPLGHISELRTALKAAVADILWAAKQL